MTEHDCNPVIVVNNVSKTFPLRLNKISFRREALSIFGSFLNPNTNRQQYEQFQVLKNISFNICQGESVALIGKNGAGKTTLLRMLANILKPSTGEIIVKERFSALISLGAGFINTLSGRENIYLNAAMYGVSPAQVEEIIDDIIEFADIGRFIDVPVQDYSSGMNARLGFSIAVHIFPEIIFIDEVLGVGDADFRAKCDAKINELKAKGKTFVIVSHSEQALRNICERGLLIHRGNLVADGSIEEIFETYRQLPR